MTGKGSELTKEMKTRKIDIAAVQEVKWSGGKAKDLSDGYKILYNGSGTKRNGVGVIVAPNLRDCVAQVHRYSDRFMAVTLDIEASRITVFSAYAPQSGCSDAEKGEFYSLLSREYDAQPGRKVLMGDFNGHVGKQADMKCHGGHGYGDRNDEGERLLDFAEQRGLVLINTYFPKRDSHLITYNSGDRNSQIDFILAQKRDFKKFLDAKVIPSTNVAPQHRMLIADTRFPIPKPPKADRTQTARIKWWKLPELQKRPKHQPASHYDCRRNMVKAEVERSQNRHRATRQDSPRPKIHRQGYLALDRKRQRSGASEKGRVQEMEGHKLPRR